MRENRSSRRPRLPAPAGPAALLFLLLAALAHAGENKSIRMENKEVELESLRSRIREVQSSIDTAKNNSETYLRELQEKEKAAARTARELRETEEKIRTHEAKLEDLEKRKSALESDLKHQRRLLADQIRVSYLAGRHDFIRMLLNQEDPARVGRMVAYHEYYTRARARRIESVKTSLQQLHSLQSSIGEETENLKVLRAGHQTRLAEYRKYRQSRQDVIAELQAYIEKQGKELQHLQRNEKELSSLLNRLKSEQLAIQAYEDLPPFNTLRGKLAWPVDGKFLNSYGESLRGGKLRTHGVRIAAQAGADVHAISGGKVIFADWFRNLGLLIILDHGDGYMSLYGNNERLMKKPGDMVSRNEVIAKVGDTGGQKQAGVYFEIRRKGTPLNPSLWCSR